VPDEQGTQTADAPDTSLHAYGDGHEEDAQEGSRGVTGQAGGPDEASYQEGGHADDTEFGDTPAATGPQDAAGADTGAGAGAADPDGDAGDGGRNDNEGFVDPEDPARADASRPPRGVAPA
jgi:hypothetical protein